MSAQFNDFLDADFIPPQTWRLNSPLILQCDPVENYMELWRLDQEAVDVLGGDHTLQITAPADYTCNLASTPRALWWLVAPFDVARAAVIHDYLYDRIQAECFFKHKTLPKRHKKKLRKAADDVFYLAMTASVPAVPMWKVKICYAAVRVFGGFNIKGY